jgi:signal transduction histidine kinase
MDTRADILRKRSLTWTASVVTALFGLGTALGVGPLLDGSDPGAFFAPLMVVAIGCATMYLVRAGRHGLARTLLTTMLFVYLALTLFLAPLAVRTGIGFPVVTLMLLLLHLLFRARRAGRLGWALVLLQFVAAGAVAAESASSWAALSTVFAQTLVVACGNAVLVRLGSGWEDAIDETLKAREELAHAAATAMEASQAKSTFLASMSHELRTPLNGIIGYAELIEEGLDEGEPARPEDLLRIQRAGAHLLELVDQVLDLSRVESGRMEFVLASTDVAALVAEVAESMRPQVEGSDNRLVVELEPVDPLPLDALRARQILTNLIGNATKFTDGGQITLHVRQEPGAVIIDVADTGAGIPADRLGRIFEPFRQADPTIAGTHGGTGLGLPISRALAAEMGGQLTVQSVLGEGSVFRIRFPRV